jgi:endonuclease-3 related protein
VAVRAQDCKPQPAVLRRAYALLFRRFGHQQWWPARTPFEVCVGALLTQNTNWTNVTRAIANLRAAGVLSPRRLHALPERRLAALIRPAGYFNVKARRLRAFLRVLVEDFAGQLKRLFAGPTPTVRARLLAIHGIGPETADSMLLYAGGHFSFVVDAYTQRIFRRHGWCRTGADYDELQRLLASALDGPQDAAQLDYWQDYHAQLVRAGNAFCRARQPDCAACPLKSLLPPDGPAEERDGLA